MEVGIHCLICTNFLMYLAFQCSSSWLILKYMPSAALKFYTSGHNDTFIT